MVIVAAPITAFDAKLAGGDVPRIGLGRLYLLRLAYLIMGAGLAIVVWPRVISHTSDFALAQGIRCSLLAGLGATALLGLRYPLKMLPILIFELTWKAIYLLAFALPLWRSAKIDAAAGADIRAVAMVAIFVPLIPWGYVFRQYVLQPGERWR